MAQETPAIKSVHYERAQASNTGLRDLGEPYLTVGEAASLLHVPYWKLQRSIKRGVVPHYRPFNSRILVKISEVMAVIESSRSGGQPLEVARRPQPLPTTP